MSLIRLVAHCALHFVLVVVVEHEGIVPQIQGLSIPLAKYFRLFLLLKWLKCEVYISYYTFQYKVKQTPGLNRESVTNERHTCESRKKHDENVKCVHGGQAVPEAEFMQSAISGIS
jgi:hypothetical protein